MTSHYTPTGSQHATEGTVPPTIRLATFNVAQTYNPIGIQHILHKMQIDILATQEPPTTPAKPQQNKQHNRGLDQTIHIIDSVHQKYTSPPIFHLASYTRSQ